MGRPKKNIKSRYINLYLPEELVEQIDKAANEDERSRNFVIKKILEKYMGERKK